MTTLIDIPSCRVDHLPTPTSQPVPLSSGDLTLTVLPANPPSHPSPTLTLTVGSSSFPLLPSTPVQKVRANKEHASYAFSPAPADGGAPIGQVRIVLKDSTNQGEWEATEALSTKFQTVLKEHGVWEDKELFVNDEYEQAGASQKGWGESLAAAVVGASQSLAERLGAFTDTHITHTNPTHPPPPSEATAARAASAKETTGSIASSAEAGATWTGHAVHEVGKTLGKYVPDSMAQSTPDAEKSATRKEAEGVWEQVKVAATGVGKAAYTVGTAVSDNAHRAIEHNFGKDADKVAQDIGQAHANVGSTVVSAGTATSAIVHGNNLATGASSTAGKGDAA